jgi:enoyl-CoA hydratase/carnithine racemase
LFACRAVATLAPEVQRMNGAAIAVERRGPAAWLTVTAGHTGNLPPDLARELAETLAALADEPAVRVAVLRAAGDVLARDWDRAALIAGTDLPDGVHRLSDALQAMAAVSLPVIALLDGEVRDAGLAIALACDVRLASSTATFGVTVDGSGRLPLGGTVARLVRLAGRAVVLRMLLTGEALTAAEALACGLVSGVWPPERLAAEAERLAGVIAARGPIAVRYAKEAVTHGTEMPLEQALRYETDLTIILQTTADRAEGVRAFIEKRPPRFSGT